MSKLLINIISISIFCFVSCISPRIYIPKSNSVENEIQSGDIQVNSDNEYDILWDPILLTTLFYTKKYNGRFGSVQSLIEKEINSSGEFSPKKISKVEIETFKVNVSDECKKNITSIDVKINAYRPRSKKPFYTYKKNESIKSYVSDCSSMIYTLTIFGLLWYVPHVGVKGTREDQIEFLVNSNLGTFMEGLKNAK